MTWDKLLHSKRWDSNPVLLGSEICISIYHIKRLTTTESTGRVLEITQMCRVVVKPICSLLLFTKYLLCAWYCAGCQRNRGGQDMALLLRGSSTAREKRRRQNQETEQEKEGRGFRTSEPDGVLGRQLLKTWLHHLESPGWITWEIIRTKNFQVFKYQFHKCASGPRNQYISPLSQVVR